MLTMSIPTTSGLEPPGHVLTTSPWTNLTVSVSTVYATVKVTDGGLPARRPFKASPERGQSAKIYGFTDLDGSQPDAGRYIVAVQDAGKRAGVTGYR
jgi:hypothetical protein